MRLRGLYKLLNGRDWQWEKLGLALVGRALIIKALIQYLLMGRYWINYLPGGSDGKASVYNPVDLSSIPGLGRSPGEGDGNPLQDCCLGNPMDRGAWRAAVHGVAKSQT